MLLPRFTIRTILAMLTVASVVFVVAGMAYRGQTWAWGVTIGVIAAALTALVQAGWFGMVWLVSQASPMQDESRLDSSVAGSELIRASRRTLDPEPISTIAGRSKTP